MVTLNGSGALSYTWDGGVSNGTPFASPIGTVVYTVTGTAANSCTNTDMVSVTTNTLPSVSFTLPTDTVCNTSATFALSGGLPSGGVYSGTGVSSGNFRPVTAGVGTFAITYTYTDVNSCQSMISQNMVVDICTSIGTANNELITKMFPNPTTGSLNIEVNNENKEYDLYLTDVTGREIFKTTSDKNKTTLTILIWILTPMLFLLFYHGNKGYVWDYYFTGIYPHFILLVAAVLARSELAGVVITLIFLTSNLFTTYNFIAYAPTAHDIIGIPCPIPAV